MAFDNCFCSGKLMAASNSHRAEHGFTLVELISAVAIIGLLAAISIPFYSEYIDKVRIERTIVEIRMLEKEIIVYKMDKGNLPDALADIGHGTLKDPWGTLYQYLSFEKIKGNGKKRKYLAINPLNTDYDLYSMGKNRITKLNLNNKDSEDDIVRAIDGGYVGLASKF